jgi:hypothetical protein
MATPVPTPTARQLVKMSDILDLETSAEALAAVSDFDQDEATARWAETLDDLTSYDAASSDAGDVKRVGQIEFFGGKNGEQLLWITNRIRRRYGIEEISSLSPNPFLETTLKWF